MVDFKNYIRTETTFDSDVDPYNDADIQNDGRWLQEQEDQALIEAEQGREIALRMQASLPRYLQELEKLPCSPEEKVEMLSLFEGGEVIPFTKFVNKVVTIIGCIVWTRPPYLDRTTGEEKEGYDQIRYMLDDFTEEGVPKIMSGSSGLINHTQGMLAANGWYLWEKPVRYKCLWDGSGTPFRMINQDRVDKMRAAKEARTGK